MLYPIKIYRQGKVVHQVFRKLTLVRGGGFTAIVNHRIYPINPVKICGGRKIEWRGEWTDGKPVQKRKAVQVLLTPDEEAKLKEIAKETECLNLSRFFQSIASERIQITEED